MRNHLYDSALLKPSVLVYIELLHDLYECVLESCTLRTCRIFQFYVKAGETATVHNVCGFLMLCVFCVRLLVPMSCVR